MVARFVAAWRSTGKAASSRASVRITPRHAAILVTRPIEKMTNEQQQLFDRILAQCPDVLALRQISLAFRAALTATTLPRYADGLRVPSGLNSVPLFDLPMDYKKISLP